MFRKMRREKQSLSQSECETILNQETSGVLAVLGDDGYPYAVPMSFVYDNGKLYFHSAKTGHKIEAIKAHPQVSFCVIAQDNIVPEEYTTYYQSVIAFGKINIIEDETKKYSAIQKLTCKYAPLETLQSRQNIIQKEWDSLCMLEMDIDHLTGKEAIELVRKKNKE